MASPRNRTRDPSRLVDGDALRRLQVPQSGALVRAFAVSHLGLLVAFGLPLLSPTLPAYAIAVVLAIGVQTRLAVLMHEAAHGLLHRDRRRNDLLGNWLAAYAIGTTVETYRAQHLQHHANLGTPLDPDFTTLCVPPIRRGLAASVVGCLAGLRHAQLVRKYLGRSPDAGAAERGRAVVALFGRAVWQGALLGACAAAGQPLVYVVVWLFPLFTVSVLVNELRSVVEHTPLVGGAGGGEPLPSITRTVRAGWIGRGWIGPLNFHYHLEHHLHPRVPFSRLRELHELLVERGHYDLRPELLCDGYGEVLRAVWRRYRRPRTRPRITIEDGTYVVHGG
jgi:fatty acid desaturase